jgi:hypothetical protein
MQLLGWLDQTALALWVRESEWGYPIVLTAHVIGMSAVVGTVLMFGLRALGYAARVPLAWLDSLFSLAWSGFALNALSGIALFVAESNKFLTSTAFQIKMASILAGCVSIWLVARSRGDSGQFLDVASARTKVIAVISMTLWLGAIVAGRLIAYTTTSGGPAS